MGAKVDNTPRFVLPRIVDTVTNSVSLSKNDTNKKTIYTHNTGNGRDLVTIAFSRGTAPNVKSAIIYLNGNEVGTTKNANVGFGIDNNLPASRAIVTESSRADCSFGTIPLILEDGDVISLSKSGYSGSDSTATVFTLTVNIWE